MRKRKLQDDLRQLLFSWSPRYTISARETAKALGISINTVCRMIEHKELEAERINPEKVKSRWRVNYDSLIALMERRCRENGLEKRF